MRPVLYVRFKSDWLSVRLVGTRSHWEGPPSVAVDERSAQVLGVGSEASNHQAPFVQLLNGFGDALTIIDDANIAAIALRFAASEVLQSRHGKLWPSLPLKPDMVLHPTHASADGLSAPEVQGLVALGGLAGARKVSVWLGRGLSDADIKSASSTSGLLEPRSNKR